MATVTDVDDYVRQHFRWNFNINLAETSICMFGYGFFGFQTFLPVFLSMSTDSKILIGLVSASIPVGWLLPQIFVAPWVESLAQKKPVVVRLAFIEKILYLVLAGLAFASSQMKPGLFVFLFLTLCFLIGLAGGVTRVGWGELIAIIFPPKARGHFFGATFFVGGLLGAIGAYLAGLILSRYNPPYNYGLSFFVGFCLIIFSWMFLLRIREPPAPHVPRRRMSQNEFFRGLGALLKQDRKFASFILAQGFITLAGMAFYFVAVFGQEKFHLNGYQLGLLTTSLLLGSTLPAQIFGWLGDRFSRWKMLIIGPVCQILGFALAVWSANDLLLYLAVFVLGIGRASTVNIQPIVYDYAPLLRRPTYIGLSSTLFGVMSVIAPLFGGLVAQASSYGFLFSISALLSIVALFLYLAIVREPLAAADTL